MLNLFYKIEYHSYSCFNMVSTCLIFGTLIKAKNYYYLFLKKNLTFIQENEIMKDKLLEERFLISGSPSIIGIGK